MLLLLLLITATMLLRRRRRRRRRRRLRLVPLLLLSYCPLVLLRLQVLGLPVRGSVVQCAVPLSAMYGDEGATRLLRKGSKAETPGQRQKRSLLQPN